MHGVGGSPGSRLLGYEDPRETPILSTRDGVTIRQRRDTTFGRIQAFDWGELNSSSRFHAAWVFLAPFTLLNVAGWSVPRPTGRVRGAAMRAAQALVIVLGWLLTLTTASWMAEILIDHIGYQWLPTRLRDGPAAGGGWTVGPWTLSFSLGGARIAGVIAASLLTLALLVAASVLAGRAHRGADEPEVGDPPFRRGCDLADPRFFARRPSWAASGITHLVLAFAAVAVVVGQAVVAMRSDSLRTAADVTVTVVQGAQLSLLVVFLLVAVIVRIVFQARGVGVAWALATVAFGVTDAFLAGVELWSLARVSHPNGSASIIAWTHLVVVDAYFWIVVAWVAIALAVVAVRGRLPGLPHVCGPDMPPLRKSWLRRVSKAQGAARLMRTVDRFVFVFAVVYLVLSIGFALARAGSVIERIRDGTVVASALEGTAAEAAGWLLVGGVVFVAVRARKAASDNRTRRFIGQAWDALAFWPRRFHPFAVRPYTHVAVPALRDHITAIRSDGPVLVSAHSQGSALAAVALLQMGDLDDVGLVTYGSHLGTLYRRAFPSYFGESDMRVLLTKLDGDGFHRWRNLFRLTDPVGGPIFCRGDKVDVCVADPATSGPIDDARGPPLEVDRDPWMDLAIHSHYLRERAVKRAVDEIKEQLREDRSSER